MREGAIVIRLYDIRRVTSPRLVSVKAMTTLAAELALMRSHLLRGEALFMIDLAHLRFSTTISGLLSHLQLRHFSLQQ